MSHQNEALVIKAAAHEGCRDIHGYIVANEAEGAEFRVFGWAATMRQAKRLLSDVRKNRALFGGAA